MPISPSRREGLVGIDVAKASVVIYDQITDTYSTVANTLDDLIGALTPLAHRDLAVCEATGGHEDNLLAALHSLGIPLHRADGGRLSAYARSLRRAKTDRIDAKMLARYGLERGPALQRHAPKDQNESNLVALVRRRIDLVELRKIERTRAKAPRAGLIADFIARAIDFLDAEIQQLDACIRDLLENTPRLARRRAKLETIPGVGTQTATTLIATMPELGTLSRRKAASLAAVAPHPRDSGSSSPKRITTGGRRQLRPVLFIAALAATRGQNAIATFYRRLIANGKPKRLALVAVMRKIITIANARLAQLT